MAQTFAKTSISSEAAHRMIGGAEAKAAEIGTPMVIAVVDDGGVLKAFSRMDGAALLSVQVAQDKAYTAVGFSMPTHGWHDFIKDDPPLRDGVTTGLHPELLRGWPLNRVGAVVERDQEVHPARVMVAIDDGPTAAAHPSGARPASTPTR